LPFAAGLEIALDYLAHFRYHASDLGYLEQLGGTDGRSLFNLRFLEYLGNFSFKCDIDAVPEETPVFPYEPILRVQGPILHAQLRESPLLNIINFQTLIATKSARICWAARPDLVVEFGLRRAQEVDGALAASRAAFIGGCDSTSNVLAGKIYGIPVKGTHAHSWIMAFEDEEAFFHPSCKRRQTGLSIPPLTEIREKTLEELSRFDSALRRFLYPQHYFVGLEQSLYETKLSLIKSMLSH
jgi:nicotinate phosphoribosyltransferase